MDLVVCTGVAFILNYSVIFRGVALLEIWPVLESNVRDHGCHRDRRLWLSDRRTVWAGGWLFSWLGVRNAAKPLARQKALHILLRRRT